MSNIKEPIDAVCVCSGEGVERCGTDSIFPENNLEKLSSGDKVLCWRKSTIVRLWKFSQSSCFRGSPHSWYKLKRFPQVQSPSGAEYPGNLWSSKNVKVGNWRVSLSSCGQCHLHSRRHGCLAPEFSPALESDRCFWTSPSASGYSFKTGNLCDLLTFLKNTIAAAFFVTISSYI